MRMLLVQNLPAIARSRSLSAWICEAEVSPREPSRVYSVHYLVLFIINERAANMNVIRPAAEPDLDVYRPALQKWMPKAEIRALEEALVQFDGVVTWKTAGGAVRYLVEEKRHLRHQDVGVVIEQLNRRRATLPPGQAGDRILFLAPHVRRQQAAAFERAEDRLP